MLSQCPMDQFIFKIRVLLNKTVEFALTCLSCSQIAALSRGSRHYSRKIRFFSQIAKEKKCAKALGPAITCWVPPLIAFFKKSQAASGSVFIWMGDRFECFEQQR